MIVADNLLTESDVEQKVILPLLTEGNLLAIDVRRIKTKDYLAPSILDKGAGRTGGYYPDYSIWEKAFPVMIIEAKSPDVRVEVGYREATGYAHHLNKQYRPGTNPCRFVLACNGIDLLFGQWDSEPLLSAKVADLLPGTETLETLRRHCGSAKLAEHALDCLRGVRLERAVRPFNIAGGQALLLSTRPLNSFAAELSPVLRRYFSSQADNRDPDIYGRAYVNSAEATEYDRVLEALLKDRIASRLNPLAREIEPSRHGEPNLSKALDAFDQGRPKEGQLQLITGRVGAGKSLFIRRYINLLQPPNEKPNRLWSIVNFNDAPADLRDAQNWLCEAFLQSFVEENPDLDIYGEAALEHVFAVELNKQRGIYSALEKISKEDAQRKRISDIEGWKKDPQTLAFGICRYFGGIQRKLVAIVMDNVDRRELRDQLDAFQLALWFLKESRAFVVLQLRDETYERFKNVPPLDTYRTGIGFHISPPRFVDVVKKRLDLSLEFLIQQTSDNLSYALPNGIRITYPNSRVGEFLRALYVDLFHRKKNVSRVLQGLAGNDVRKALEMFISILTSGHLSEAALTSTAQGGAISIPEFTILKILMRTEYRFFNDGSGFVKNIFAFENNWENPNNFLLIEILYFLTANRRVRGQIGLEGYFSIAHLADRLQLQGFVRQDVLSAANNLLRGELVEADHMSQREVDFDDCVRISPSGFIHLRILSERLEYLYGVLPVTPFADNSTAQKIANYIGLENQYGSLSGHQTFACVKEFGRYLEYQANRLRSNCAAFGGPNSGTAYILNQVKNTLAHFERPTDRSLPNLLDR